ncbi:MAG: CARDB domain-containing protein [Candidatus Thermoplasmatota archaeon]
MKALALLVLLLAVLAVPLPAAEAQGPVSAVIQGPTAIAPSSTHEYTATVTGGPAEVNGTFEIQYVLQGTNLQGGDPQIARTLANREGQFRFNITAPEAEGTVQLYVKARSGGETGNETAEARYWIDVFRPVDLRATIRNNGAAAVVNVTVFFYVDGRLVGNRTVSRIDAGGTAEVNVTFIPVDLGVGRHAVRVTADLDGDGAIDANAGELLVSEFFYKSERSNTQAILGTITVFIIVVLVLVLLAIRRQRRQG